MNKIEILPEPTVAAPVKPVERIVDLDILRGIALFGILVVNLYIFSNPIAILVAGSEMWTEWYNQTFLFFSRVFFEGKFITLFSFLFGLGFYIFTERLKIKDLPIRRVFFRRMFLLFLIGIIHAMFFWAGDILAPYAISGIIIMLFLYRTDKTIKVWIVVFAGGFLLFFTLLIFFIMWGMSMPDVAGGIKQGFVEANEEFINMLARGYEVYLTGTFSEMMAYRGEEIGLAWTGMFITPMGIPFIIAIFLFGFLIGRKGLLQNPTLLRSLFIPHRWKLLIAGIMFSVIYATSYHYQDPVIFDLWMLIQMYSIIIGAPLLMLGYSGFILKCLEENNATAFLHRFAPVGRMALTNYFLQTVICTTIFYGYGLGWIGHFEPIFILPLALFIFLVQVFFSEWYLAKYKMGPLEKLWRMGTYIRIV
ncbi:MAG: DUF418 domain-containing protein [Balneolaceae bacterium]|nr:MAG: DUF418 domain-containing protein [Balneolaceae bacterium]